MSLNILLEKMVFKEDYPYIKEEEAFIFLDTLRAFALYNSSADSSQCEILKKAFTNVNDKFSMKLFSDKLIIGMLFVNPINDKRFFKNSWAFESNSGKEVLDIILSELGYNYEEMLLGAINTYNVSAINHILNKKSRKQGPSVKSSVPHADKAIMEILPYMVKDIDMLFHAAEEREDYDTMLLILKYVIDNNIDFDAISVGDAALEGRFDVIDAYIKAMSNKLTTWHPITLSLDGQVICSTKYGQRIRCEVSNEAIDICKKLNLGM